MMKPFYEIIDKLAKNQIKEWLYLERQEIDDDKACKLAEALTLNSSITKLILSENNIGSRGAQAIAMSLKVNKTLTLLKLEDNNLGPEGGMYIADALQSNTTLTNIGLSNINLGPEGGKYFAEALKTNKSLTGINLCLNRLGNEGGIAIAEALKSNKTLTVIFLSGNGFSSESEMHIANALKINKSLTRIDLGYNKLDAKSCKYIAEALLINKTLTYIDLECSTPEGVHHIMNAMKVNRTVTRISFTLHNLGSSLHSTLKHIAKVLEVNKTLTYIWFDNEDSDPDGVYRVRTLLKRNENIKFIENEIIQLMPDTPLINIEEGNGKEAAEEFDVQKYYQSILSQCENLQKQYVCPKEIIDELYARALLAFCSWDLNALSPEERIKELYKLIKLNKNLDIYEKSLSLLARIFETLGMIELHEKNNKLADDHFLSAYVFGLQYKHMRGLQYNQSCELDRLKDKETEQLTANVLALWIDKEVGYKEEQDRQNLEEELANTHKDKFKQLRESYISKCKELGFAPFSHLADILEKEKALEVRALKDRTRHFLSLDEDLQESRLGKGTSLNLGIENKYSSEQNTLSQYECYKNSLPKLTSPTDESSRVDATRALEFEAEAELAERIWQHTEKNARCEPRYYWESCCIL